MSAVVKATESDQAHTSACVEVQHIAAIVECLLSCS